MLPVLDDIISTGTAIVGFSAADDLSDIKNKASNHICLLGNMNAIEMRNWSTSDIECEVKQILSNAGKGGGLILSDNHGEIPWQVPEDVLLGIAEAVRKHGNYSFNWLE